MTVTTGISAGKADGSVGVPTLIYVGKADGSLGKVVAIWQGLASGSASKIYSDTAPPAPPPPSPPAAQIVAQPASQSQTVSYAPGSSYSFSASGAATGDSDPFTNKAWSASDGGSGTGWSGHVTIKPSSGTAGTSRLYQATITFKGLDSTSSTNRSGSGSVNLTVNY